MSEGSLGVVVPSEIYRRLEYWDMKCGLIWVNAMDEM